MALSACSGGARATATPAVRVEDVLVRSASVMTAVDSFRFVLRNEGGETPIPGGFGLRSAEGVMSKPDRIDVTVKATLSGFIVELHVISVDDTTYMTNPITGAWQTFEVGLSPIAFFDPATGVNLILESMLDPILGENTVVDGVSSHRVTGKLPASAAQFIAGGYIEGAVLDAELLIGEDDSLLRRVELRGVLTEGEPPGIVRVLNFSEFGHAFEIEAPI